MARKGNIIAVSSYKGVFISLNNGNYWTKASNGLYNSDYVESLLFYGNKIFAATSSHGIYVSSNNGNNWSATNSQPQDLYILTFMQGLRVVCTILWIVGMFGIRIVHFLIILVFLQLLLMGEIFI
jgi:hypothetical protein